MELSNSLWVKISHGGVAKFLWASLQCPLEVDGEDNGDADDAHNHQVDDNVALEGQVLHCVPPTLSQDLLISIKSDM